MNEWTVVTVIATLFGLCAAVIRPLISLNGTIRRLIETAKGLEKNISCLASKNSESHERLWGRVAEHDETLNSHETRLTVMENMTQK